MPTTRPTRCTATDSNVCTAADITGNIASESTAPIRRMRFPASPRGHLPTAAARLARSCSPRQWQPKTAHTLEWIPSVGQRDRQGGASARPTRSAAATERWGASVDGPGGRRVSFRHVRVVVRLAGLQTRRATRGPDAGRARRAVFRFIERFGRIGTGIARASVASRGAASRYAAEERQRDPRAEAYAATPAAQRALLTTGG